jgi:hypothetical protein
MTMRLTDIAGALHFVSYGCDPGVLNMNVSLEPDDLAGATSEHLVLEIIAASIVDAQQLAAQHNLDPDHTRASRLSPGTLMWSGWITKQTPSTVSRGVRCVLYAHPAPFGMSP